MSLLAVGAVTLIWAGMFLIYRFVMSAVPPADYEPPVWYCGDCGTGMHAGRFCGVCGRPAGGGQE